MAPARAQQEAPARVDAKWILVYERAYGEAGIQVQEPPPGDEAARVRRVLLELTLAAREHLASNPNDVITIGALRGAGLIAEAPLSPQGGAYLFDAESRQFTCTLGPPHDLRTGAALQLAGVDAFISAVSDGSPELRRNWEKLYNDPKAPATIKREIEARMFALNNARPGRIQALAQVQVLLRELNDAIELAAASGLLEPRQEITMQDVGATGLIPFLEALPGGGKYEVTRVGEPPVAVYGETRVPFDPLMVERALLEHYEALVAQKPDYPPALALLARAKERDEAERLLDRAIALWPDVPALRIQRLSRRAAALEADLLAEDLDAILATFPAAPVLVEVVLAAQSGELGEEPQARADIAAAVARVRPDVLVLQLAAIKELKAAGRASEAAEVRERLLAQHPGYEALLAP